MEVNKMEEIREIKAGIKELTDSIKVVDERIITVEEKLNDKIRELEKKFEEYEKHKLVLQQMGSAGEAKIAFYETLGRAIQDIISTKGTGFSIPIWREGGFSPEIRSVITPADLANLVEPQFIPEVYRVISEYGLVRKLFDTMQVKSNSIRTNKADGYVQVYWRSKQTPKQTRETALPTIQGVTVNLEWLDAFVVISKDSVRFSSFVLGNYVIEKLGEGFARYEDFVGFQGTAANDIYDGVINLTGVNVYSLPAGKTSYTQVTADDFRKAIDVLPLRFRTGGAFVMHPTIKSILELLKDGQGRYIYRAPGDATEPGTLWGYPVYITEEMPAVDGPNKPFAIFGNFKHSRFYYYQDVTFDITDQATVTLADNTNVNLWQIDAFATRGSEMIAFSHFFPQAYVVMKTAAV